ncbi:glutamine synthetase [Romboutsia sp. 1001216sp1]|uniref:glutamine synthetase n=1 Tax=Romboutsia sp. 1001216sp1 TaxID=2986997 RepID=UPI002330EB64|nr:glutamine synthetase [Romboutsia sp. 1001216sp1]MDB8804335.1 glutamine synthetase [Romboutsia sp. 1001216sp1]MDB8807707.1 glutamine synthetase [Romboutsia sp. 1001216sp1]MDB8809981.1 glutamine synthetase [Romboutsia sp. 1001216sp1]MDB8815731.1 glutamine synthetase [Romboutsia sp. 1001216sp1]MDB8819421.1 glutamine synthetase [Romboutsia sp. 1001216sp1]
MQKLLYTIERDNHNEKNLRDILSKNKHIKFVSLMGVDLGGNATDEKIPMELFLDDIDNFLESAVQTDGSSVELYNIATLNNAKVDLMPDTECTWFIDYNFEHIDEETNLPVGTLRIPAFLIHENKKVCSRGILKKSEKYFKNSIIELFREYPHLINNIGIEKADDIEDIILTAATELEFWVNTPEDKADLEKLSVSQSLKEQYWKRTHGIIRTCLEKSIIVLQKMGINPEMAHKEVGGINSSISIDGKTNHAMEQLEISWKFSSPIQTADNELLVREIIEDVFTSHGLEVTFKAKPIHGVAGSGGHTHVGVSAKLKDGSIKNLFAPRDMNKDYVSEIGYGALMGILKNYEVLNPIVTATNDGFNRLVPGFEAPVCIVTSLGHSYKLPSRNRSVLVGLVRDIKNPKTVRFELRSPNPLSNTYLVIAGCYQTMLDGIKAVAKSKLTTKELEKEISKDIGEESFYLEKNRSYRDENDVFEYYTIEERNERFSAPPATVYENMRNLEINKSKVEVLKMGDVFTEAIIDSFKTGAIDKWTKELNNRIIQNDREIIRNCVKLHDNENMDALDEVTWNKICDIKFKVMKDTLTKKSLFTEIKEAIEFNDFEKVSKLQLELNGYIEDIQALYADYKKNIY